MVKKRKKNRFIVIGCIKMLGLFGQCLLEKKVINMIFSLTHLKASIKTGEHFSSLSAS